ncbi:PREDICTED: WAS/WASL-interacting protein family member 1-like, partial [Trachymyrmex septentrionalis]|uniref:WAS/WASL-interacting protein family member 1-like n=1 Tax=Trachymyrmex septentrionalis TaxID=34720 RepID=UPI00084F533C
VTRPEPPHPSGNPSWSTETKESRWIYPHPQNNMPRLKRPYKEWLRNREARRLLDEEFRKYLGGSREQSRPAEDHLPSPSSPPAPPANQLEVIPPPQPPSPSPQPSSPLPQTPLSPPQTPSPPPRSPSPVFSDALMERIFPDTPPLSPDSSVDPIPISPRGILPPTNSTDSVEFLEEISPPPPRSYFQILENDTLESLISQFPRTTTASIPQGAYTIGPHYFDPEEIRNAITGQNSISCIPPELRQSIPSSSGILLQSFPSFLRFHPRNRLIKSHPILPTTRCT